MQEKTFNELLNVEYSEKYFGKIISQGSKEQSELKMDENTSQGSKEQSKLKMKKVVSIVIISLIKKEYSVFEDFRTALKNSGSENLFQKLGE